MSDGVSRYGVCYDLPNSPYTYERDMITYHFSTPVLMQRFKERVAEAERATDGSLSNRFHMHVCFPQLGALQLYRRMQGRGFYVTTPEGEAATCLEDLLCVGGRVTSFPSARR